MANQAGGKAGKDAKSSYRDAVESEKLLLQAACKEAGAVAQEFLKQHPRQDPSLGLQGSTWTTHDGSELEELLVHECTQHTAR